MQYEMMALETAKPRHLSAGRWYRPLAVGLTAAILLVGVTLTVAYAQPYVRLGLVGIDFRLFAEIGRRFAETGSGYAPFQLEGPYRYDQGSGTADVASMPDLYPPYIGPVFAVVRFLPPVLWWAIPLSILAALIVSWRPAQWTWPVMALALFSANTAGILAAGGSTMWITAFIGLGLRYGWPVCLVALKPTFLPFALIGWRDRRTWLGLAIFAVLAYFLTAELARYVVALQNVEGASVLYSLGDLPFVLVPVIAYLGKSRPDGE